MRCKDPTPTRSLLSVVLLALLGWEFFFLLALFSSCVAGPRAATGFSAGCGAGLVDAVLNRTVSKKLGWFYLDYFVDWLLWMRNTSVWKGLPSLRNNDAYFVFWIAGALQGNGRLRDYKTLFLPFLFFLVFW